MAQFRKLPRDRALLDQFREPPEVIMKNPVLDAEPFDPSRACAMGGPERPNREFKSLDRGQSWYFWKFVHNALIHPWLALPWEPRWAQRVHDWTAERCRGGG